MKPISPRVKKILSEDPRMSTCEICDSSQVQWHHVFTYKGSQIDEAWAIASACLKHHEQATKSEIRDRFEWNAIQRMTDADIAKYPKRDWSMNAFYLSKQKEIYGW